MGCPDAAFILQRLAAGGDGAEVVKQAGVRKIGGTGGDTLGQRLAERAAMRIIGSSPPKLGACADAGTGRDFEDQRDTGVAVVLVDHAEATGVDFSVHPAQRIVAGGAVGCLAELGLAGVSGTTEGIIGHFLAVAIGTGGFPWLALAVADGSVVGGGVESLGLPDRERSAKRIVGERGGLALGVGAGGDLAKAVVDGGGAAGIRLGYGCFVSEQVEDIGEERLAIDRNGEQFAIMIVTKRGDLTGRVL